MSDRIYTNKDATAIICPPAIPLHVTDIEWCRVSEAQAQIAAANALADVIDKPDQSDGLTGRYHYDWHRIDDALAAYRALIQKGEA